MRLLLDLIRPTGGLGDAARARQPRRQPRDPAPRRASCPATSRSTRSSPGRRCSTTSAELRGGVDRAPARRAGRALRRPARPADPRALDGQPPEARAHPGVHARARAADPRRADRGPRSARAAELPRAARARSRRRAAPSSSRRTRCPRSSASPTGSRSCAAGGSSWSTRSRTCARIAVQRLEVEFAGGAAAGRGARARSPACARRTLDGRHLIVAFEGSADAIVKAHRRPRGALDPQPRRRPRGDLPALLPRRGDGMSAPVFSDGDAPARSLTTALAALGMALGDRHGRARCSRRSATRSASSTSRRASPTCSAAPTTGRSPAGCAARSARSTARS